MSLAEPNEINLGILPLAGFPAEAPNVQKVSDLEHGSNPGLNATRGSEKNTTMVCILQGWFCLGFRGL